MLHPQEATLAFLLENCLRHCSEKLAIPSRAQLGPVSIAVYVLVVVPKVGRIEIDVVDEPRRILLEEKCRVMPDEVLDLGQ